LSYRAKFSKFYKKCFISYFNYSDFLKKNFSKTKKRLNTFYKYKQLTKNNLLKKSNKFKKRKFITKQSKKINIYKTSKIFNYFFKNNKTK